MNNKPVAYVNSMCNDYINWKADPMSIDGQPLYTHPAKTLTDEEIVSLYESSYLESGLDEWEFDPVYFARAILRKNDNP
jgi:hypothetical protein